MMKAAQWDPSQKKVVVNEIPIPTPGDGQFLIKIASASLCHSDLMSIAIPDRKDPVTLGHEGAGYIHALHSSTQDKNFKVGDTVGFLYVQDGCFECAGCLLHNCHCLVSQSHTNGFEIPGFFAEYALVDWENCIVLPESMDVKEASPMFCAGLAAFHCVDSCELAPNDWVIIVGCGGLGQFAIQFAKAMGARVIGVDVKDGSLANAKAQGADLIFNSRTDPQTRDEILRVTTNGGGKAVIVFSAAEAAYDSVIPLIRVGGTLMVAGLPANGIRLDALAIATRRFIVKGDSTSTPQRMRKGIEFAAKHGVNPVIQTFSSLDAVPKMVDLMQQGKSTARMLVQFS